MSGAPIGALRVLVEVGDDGLDDDGLDDDGLDDDGLDDDGLDEDGLDEDGLDEDGLDEDGLDEDGLDEDGLDEDGLDEDGSDDDGLDEDGSSVGALAVGAVPTVVGEVSTTTGGGDAEFVTIGLPAEFEVGFLPPAASQKASSTRIKTISARTARIIPARRRLEPDPAVSGALSDIAEVS